VFTAYDLSTGEGEDYFASVTVGLDGRDLGEPQPRIYVLDAWHRRLTFMSQVGAVLNEAKLWLPRAVALEAVQYQAVLPQVLQAARDDKRTGLTADIIPVRPRLSKSLRLSAVSPLLELGRVVFNPALDPKRGLKEDLVEELATFPLAPHDDLVDAFVYATALAVDYSIRAGSSGIKVSSYGSPEDRPAVVRPPIVASSGVNFGGGDHHQDGPHGVVQEDFVVGDLPPLHRWANLSD
jgi:predicted phage terminase large subunit-like protein